MIPGSKTPRLVIFDDGQGEFGPMTDRRAVFSLRTGALSNRVRIETRLGVMAGDLHVADRLAPVQRARETDARVNEPLSDDEGSVLMVNGRWTAVDHVNAVRSLPLGHAIVQRDGQLLAAHLPARDAQTHLASGFVQPLDPLTSTTLDTAPLLSRPWHILDHLEATLASDLAMFDDHIAPTATVHPSAVLDAAAGPIVIAEHARVGPLCVLEGPCYIGPNTIVLPRTMIRRNTVLGPRCKIAGEISFSVIHGYTSKSHEGFLGHSLVGEWVNLGAATNVSNLKNTYGDVSVQLSRKGAPGSEPEDTGRTFIGPVIGDFVRTAIGTRLTTGSVIGTAAMIATSTFAPKFVERFAFLTDKGSMPTDIDKLLHTARTMMTRRELQLSREEEALLRELAKT